MIDNNHKCNDVLKTWWNLWPILYYKFTAKSSFKKC